MGYHVPVLLKESVDGLNIDGKGVYADVTFGGGGHSREIFSRLTTGRLIAFDRDEDANANMINDPRFTLVNSNYKYLKNFLDYHSAYPLDGILADLGVSSHQFDMAERGFSFRFDGPLDLRMDKSSEITGAHIINNYDESRLIHIFSFYGEIKNARTLVSKIVQARKLKPIETTFDLTNSIKDIIPGKQSNKYLALVFQALRLEANDEIGSLEQFLLQCQQALKPGGRLVVISYHSLEDRLVKNIMKTGNLHGDEIKDFYGKSSSPYELITRKPIEASENEVNMNNRARSAKLRIAERRHDVA